MYAPDGVLATFQGEIQHTQRSCYLGKIARKRRQGVGVDSKLETPNCTHSRHSASKGIASGTVGYVRYWDWMAPNVLFPTMLEHFLIEISIGPITPRFTAAYRCRYSMDTCIWLLNIKISAK